MRSKALILVMALLFLVCLFSSSHAAQEIKLRYASFYPAANKIGKLGEEWCKEVEKRTNGRIKISYFPGGSLVPSAQVYDSVTKGVADIGQTLFAYSPGRFPMMQIFGQPIGIKHGYQATKLVNEFYNKFQPKELSDTQVMYIHASGPGLIHAKKPLKSLGDVQGLKIKTNPDNGSIIKALGGAPVNIPITETYDALRTGVVDGVLLPNEGVTGWKMDDHLNSTLELYSLSYTTAIYVVMNKEKWESIPKDLQKIILEINQEWIERHGRLWNSEDEAAVNKLKAKPGYTWTTVPPTVEQEVAAKMKPILEEAAKSLNEKGLPGTEALNFILEFIKKNP